MRVLFHQRSKTLICVACDGAGSASHGGQGAALAARTISQQVYSGLKRSLKSFDQQLIWDAVDLARDQIALAAKNRDLTSRDFATTLVLCLTNGSTSIVAHVGDGAIIARARATSDWMSLSWPEHGEYASTTYFLSDDGELRMRVTRFDEKIDRLVLMTDGLERLALDFAKCTPHAPFFAGVANPVASGSSIGCNKELSKSLREYLASPKINERTDDDKTLIIAALEKV